MNPLNLIPAQWRIAAESLLFSALLGFATWHALSWLHARDARNVDAGRAEVRAAWDAEKIAQQRAALAAQAQQAREAAERREVEKRKADEDSQRLAAMAADRDAAVRDADRLRQRIAYLLRPGPGGGAGAAASQPATGIGSTADALGNLLGACAAEYQRLAADADADRAAGIECEWRYNALTK